MTKIKNTKKGMAKKTLSMSLVVAMLATSNVPVWAAEFSDGSDAAVATEAPAEDAFSDDADVAPVVEDNSEDVVSAQAEDSKYTVAFKDVPEKAEWRVSPSDYVKFKVKVTNPADSNNNVTGLKYVAYVTDNGVDYTSATTLSASADGYAEVDVSSLFIPENVGKKVRVRVYETDATNNVTWYEDSADITVAKQTLAGTLDLTGGNVSESTAVHYTGKTITTVPTTATAENVTYAWNGGNYNYNQLKHDGTTSDVKLSAFTITGDDLVNSVDVSKKNVTATADIESKYYDGKVAVTYQIWRKVLSTDINDKNYIGNNIKVELPKYTYQYTGNAIRVKSKDITVTDLNTGKVVENAVNDTNGYYTISSSGNVTTTPTDVDVTLKAEGSLANYTVSGYGAINAKTAEKVSVTKRDLSDTANTTIEISTVTTDVLGANKTISADGLKDNLTIKDADGSDINKNCVKIDMGALENQPVVIGNTYTVTVKPAAGNTNVTGSRQVTFKVLARTISNATFTPATGVNLTSAESYTGEQITKNLTNITTENFESKVGTLTDKNGTKLIAGVNYSATLEFGENKNVGVASNHTGGKIIIKGLGSYEGSEKVFEFDINPRQATDVEVPEKILFNGVNQDGKDYAIVPAVVAKYAGTDGKNVKLTVPTDDYEITSELVKKTGTGTGYDDYTVTDKNEAGTYVRTTITKKANTTSNFVIPEKTSSTKLFAVTKIVNKAITDADIQMNKTTYTYTGKEVSLDYKVVVGGVELEKGVDYEETITNGKNVGEGVLTITGKGDYDNTTASAKFTIEAAKTSDLKVAVVKGQESTFVYNGKQKKPVIGTDLSVTLNGVDVSGEFVVSYPTSKTANVNVGKGQITLTPKKDNKNFQGVADFTFDITAATLSGGDLKVFNERNDALKDSTIASTSNPLFKYDGTAHTFAKTTYTNTVASPMKLTDNDYEIRYAENISGVSASANSTTSTGYIFVVAKGNYKNTTYSPSGIPVVNGVYTFADGSKIENIVAAKKFAIAKLAFDKDDVTISNGSYKGGNNVDPVVTVSYKGKKLVQDVDFELDYTGFTQDRTKVTNGKTLKVTVNGKGGYRANGSFTFTWGIDKFDFANATILVSGTDADPVIKVMNGSLLVDEKEYDLTVADGKATITATKDNKNYTGTQTVNIKHELEKPAAPTISSVKVTGNKATVILSDEAEGASGYDYVISTSKDPSDKDARIDVVKNQVQTTANFKYVPQGTYYAYCHAWTRDENGKKVFGEWSNSYAFSVTAITPDTPEILSVKTKGSTITVTYKESANSTGYDVVLGKGSKKEHGETRPYQYGKYKKLNVKPGVCKAVFKNIPAGTYYAGVHSWNRTASENDNKVFSKWSNLETAKVK